MPAGFEVYDQFGNLRVGISHRLLRFLGYVIIPGGSGPGSLTHDGLLTGTPFAEVSPYLNDGSNYWAGDDMYPISYSFSGNQLSWNVPSGLPAQIIQFGVY